MFDKLYGLFSYDIGIDLGTANTLVFVKEKGIVIREPSVIARRKKTKEVIAIGTSAKRMMGKTPPSIVTIRPLREGIIADYDATAAMISHYIRQVHENRRFIPPSLARPLVVIGVPSNVTEVEKRAVWEAALDSGARKAYLIEEPMAAALGEDVDIFHSKGVMVVDIGGGTTEIAVLSLGGIVVGRSLKTAGDDCDTAILHYVRLKHGLLLGEKTAEDLKIHIGSAYIKKSKKNLHVNEQKSKIIELESSNTELDTEEGIEVKTEKGEKMAIVRGRDIETGLPKSLRITETEVREALSPVISKIIQGINDVAQEAPPELLSDILEQGILLTGGGSQLSGLDQLLVEKVRIPVLLSDDPMTSVVRGTGKVIENRDLLTKIRSINEMK